MNEPLVNAATAVRWLWFLALFALVGTVGFRLVFVRWLRNRPAGVEPALTWAALHGARRVGLVAATALLPLAGFRLYLQANQFVEPGSTLTLDLVELVLRSTTWGTGWLAQLYIVLLALMGLLIAGRRPRQGWGLTTVAGTAAALSASLTGHAVAGPWPPVIQAGVQAVHVLAGGMWLGTLFVLLLVGFAIMRQMPVERREPTLRGLVRAFSPVALIGAGGAATLGVVLSVAYLDAFSDLWSSSYGRTLLVKIAALIAVAALGAYHWRRLGPALGDAGRSDQFRRSATIELAFGALLLAVTAVLVALPTPH